MADGKIVKSKILEPLAGMYSEGSFQTLSAEMGRELPEDSVGILDPSTPGGMS